MKNILILIVFFIFSCAKPLVVETIQPGDDLLNCKELKYEIEKAKKLWNFSYKIVNNNHLLDKSGGVTLEIINLQKIN